MAAEKFFDLLMEQGFLSHGETTGGDCNTKVTPVHLFVKTQLKPRNRIRPLETILVTKKLIEGITNTR